MTLWQHRQSPLNGLSASNFDAEQIALRRPDTERLKAIGIMFVDGHKSQEGSQLWIPIPILPKIMEKIQINMSRPQLRTTNYYENWYI